MARADIHEYYGFRFHAAFWREREKKNPLLVTRRHELSGEHVPQGFSRIHQTPLGLEFWTAHAVGEPLLVSKLEGAGCVEVILLPRRDGQSRVITYQLPSVPVALAVSVDAATSSVALDGVFFEDAKVLNIEHRSVEIPG